MSDANFSVNFTAKMLAAEACSKGDLLVYHAGDGVWRVSTAANRAAANALSQAVALTAYGGSAVGKVSYKDTGIIPTELTGLGTDSVRKLVRASAAGKFERVASYTPGDDIVGVAEPDGRVHLIFGLYSVVAAGSATPGGSNGQILTSNGASGFGTPITPPAGALVGTTEAQTLVDKALDYPSIIGGGFTLESSTLGRIYNIIAGAISADRAVSLPNLTANDQFAMRDAAQTLINKTINSPTIDAPTVTNGIRFGAAPLPTAGHIRIGGTGIQDVMKWWRALTSTEYSLMTVDETQALVNFGSGPLPITRILGNDVRMVPGGAVNAFSAISTALQFSLPIGGWSLISQAFKLERATITFTAANYTLSAVENACPILNLTGTPGAGRDLIAFDQSKSFFIAINASGQIITIKKPGGTGYAIPVGKSAIVQHNGTDFSLVLLGA